MILEDTKTSPRMILSILWIVLMILYLYCDFFSLYRTGQIQKMMDGHMGFFTVSQLSLATMSILMIIPAIMIALSSILPAKASRWTNIIAGSMYTLVNISNVIGETWAYYLIFGILEIFITFSIVIFSIKWPRTKE